MPTFLYGFKPSSDTKERAFICLFRTLESWNLYYGDSPIPPSPDSLKASTGGPQRHHSQHAGLAGEENAMPVPHLGAHNLSILPSPHIVATVGASHVHNI